MKALHHHLITAALVAGFLVLSACSSGGGPESGTTPAPAEDPEAAAPKEVLDSVEVVPAVPPEPVISYETWTDSVLGHLTIEEKAGQLLMPWMLGDYAPVGSSSEERIRDMVDQSKIGGVIVSVGSPTEVAVKLNRLQAESKIPLLVAADLERGAGFRFRGAVYLPGPIALGGATEFPSLMALGATADEGLAEAMGRITAQEALALGVHVPFAPVLDVNNNPDNPIINVRSFGEDPNAVARLGTAFVEGLQGAGGIATGKHFPGHGDTETDSHLALPIIDVPRERLDSIELKPFQAAIDAGIQGIMTAHIAIPELTNGNGTPSTLAPEILTGLLRDEMGFDGLVFTDAMDMYAIDRLHPRHEAAVLALEAGADVILMPPSPQAALEGIVTAVEEGRITEDRLDRSVRKVLETKEALGLHRQATVPVEEIARSVGISEHEEVAQEIADRSITLLKNDRDLLPLLGTRSARVMSVRYRGSTDLMAGRIMDARLRQKYPRLSTADVGRDTRSDVYESLLQQARRSNLVVVSLYVTVVSYSGRVAIPEQATDFIQALAKEGIPHVVVSFGNPYLFTEFPDAQAYLLAWSGAEVSQRAAAQALFGEIPIVGTTPTGIPPYFSVGDGILLPVRETGRDF